MAHTFYHNNSTKTVYTALSGPLDGNDLGITHFTKLESGQYLSSGLPTLTVYQSLSDFAIVWYDYLLQTGRNVLPYPTNNWSINYGKLFNAETI